MALVFIGLVSATISERAERGVGLSFASRSLLLIDPLEVSFGVASTKPSALTSFDFMRGCRCMPCLVLPVLLLLRPRYTRTVDLAVSVWISR